MSITKFVLKRPITVLMALLCLIVFGISSVRNATLEQMPDTDTPMMIVSAGYSGASPEDMDELVTVPIENAISKLEGIENVSSTTSEGRSMVMLEYGYDQDMDEAYNDLKKALESIRGLPSDVEPAIMQMNNMSSESLSLTIKNPKRTSLYDYVDQRIVPELEKLSAVAEVSARGGKSNYIRVELKSDMMAQYGVTLNSITAAMSGANSSSPSGTAVSGNLELSVSTSMKHDTLDDLLAVPITTSKGKIVYLEDVADVSYAERQSNGASRYNGEETISLSISKVQTETAMTVSKQVKKTIEELMADDPDLTIEIVRDQADTILSSLKDVGFTMVLAVIISMLILFLFFGDFKASLIVGCSIPVSILVTLIVMTRFGMSLNVISMSGLVLSVGMMVDNSIVTLESCFRSMEKLGDESKKGYAQAALSGTGTVIMSILGSTLTTCVVFLPLVFLNGMAGKMFAQLGWVIVFSMVASFLSAVSIVPLTYMLYKPQEHARSLMNPPMRLLQRLYRAILPKLLRFKWIVMLASVALIGLTVFLASNTKSELMTSDDTGTISVSIETRPGLIDSKADDILTRAEQIVGENENVDSYMLRFGSSSGSITAYLKDDRKMSTDDLVDYFERKLADIENCTITVSASSSMSFMRRSRGFTAILQGTQYDELQEVSAKIVKELIARDDVMNVHSSIENTAPVVSINVDAVNAAAEGISASQIASQVRSALDGAELTRLTVNGNEISVKAEYPEGELETVPQLERMLISKPSGGYVSLSDVADVVYKDSPASISKTNKQYQVQITASYVTTTANAGGGAPGGMGMGGPGFGGMGGFGGANVNASTAERLKNEVILPNLSGTVSQGEDSMSRMMTREFSGLYGAIAYAVFLVFVVLAAQFESPRFSFMVMTTIPFSLAGSFVALKLTGVTISMTSLIGFLILIGTVVNNGILYVDAVNQERKHMDVREALVEAGATRLRPILMTTLTTVLAMLPMAFAIGDSGSTTQGLAVVDIGGLAFGMFVALFILPVYYLIINGKKQTAEELFDET